MNLSSCFSQGRCFEAFLSSTRPITVEYSSSRTSVSLISNHSQLERMTVKLKIYQFTFFLINLTHTEIEFDARDFGYSRRGVSVTPSEVDKRLFGYQLQRVINCGLSSVDPFRFDLFVRTSVLIFNRQTYNIFNHNCRTYSMYLLRELAPNDSEEGIRIV